MLRLLTLLAFANVMTAADKPNVLIILADDLGYSDIGCYGGEIATPHLDALAKDGVRFRQFYNCTRCCPTRASLLTGLHPHQAGVGGMNNDSKLPGYRGSPQPNTVTLAEVMKSAGYATSMVGKWHLNSGADSLGPVRRGFDEFYGMIGGFNSFHEEEPHYSRRPDGRAKREYAMGSFYSTDAFADYSRDFIRDAVTAKKPFFQYLAFNAPHFPLHARAEDIAKYKDVYTKGWDAIREQRLAKQKQLKLLPETLAMTPRSPFTTRAPFLRSGDNPAWESLPEDRRADLARRMAVYAAMVDRMDHAIGLVIAELKALKVYENTVIVFLSDNGACAEWDPFGFDGTSGPKNTLHAGAAIETMGGPGTYHSYGSGWANAGSTPFRLYKHYCHEGGIRTPCIVRWPGEADGDYRNQVCHVVDLMATCVDLSEAEYPKERNGVAVTPMEGVSLRAAVQGKRTPRELGWEHELNKAYRSGDWKLVARKDGAWELYDLAKDPTEMHDMAAKEPERVKDLAAKWDAWAKRCQVLPHPMLQEKK